ncbi:MAG: molecular chaperone HtpG, partial [Rhodospirillales bacterium 12-54-5]
MANAKRKPKSDEITETPSGSETRSFAAETARVLHLMIHALYTNRDIFLRELISNASDACDKLRYEALTNDALFEGDSELGIHLSYDEKAKTITVEDRGIGMNRDDLINNLGTIAKSGTQEFLSKLTGDSKRDSNLIGQFGVGFYASFMVADRVTVASRKAGESQAWKWESDGSGTYTISELVIPAQAGIHAANAGVLPDMDPGLRRDDGLGAKRGTRITLHLKDDAGDYLDKFKLSHIVSTYSDHINFPISLTDAEGKTETINAAQAIWTRAKSDITDEQYNEFYHHVAHSPEAPWAVLHNKAEGAVEYTSLLYIPGIKPFDLFHPERRRRVKLYVKRVFITDEGVELVPAYLRFLRGVIDSADLPLNISRETLQKSAVLDKIRESVTSRVLSE